MSAVVLDVDTGIDDAFALLLAATAPELDLLAVTCVAGNVDVDQVVRNTLDVLHLAGRADVPVARGAEHPLLEPHRPADHVHGANGLGDLALPPAPTAADPRHAVELLRDVLTESTEPVTLVATAPLTNIALLAATYPDALRRVHRLVFMGGTAAAPGNATAVAEFNTWHDPESAAVVLAAGAPTLMYGLDVFYAPLVSRAQTDRLCAADSAAARFAGALLDRQLRTRDPEGTTIGDAGTIAALLKPDLLDVVRHPVRVELSAGRTRGQTVVDRRTRPAGEQLGDDAESGTPIDVALGVDGQRMAELFVDRLLAA